MHITIELDVEDDSPLARADHIAVVAAVGNLYQPHPAAVLTRQTGSWGYLASDGETIKEVPDGRTYRRA